MPRGRIGRDRHAHLPEPERTLAAADPHLGDAIAAVIEAHGVQRYVKRTGFTPFQMLARAIVFQQLSGKAAATIWGRFAALCPGGRVTPEAIGALRFEDMRAAGLSTQKTTYLIDLAQHARNRTVRFTRIGHLEDEAVIDSLTHVKGVGRWTAQMFLMFTLLRPDVLPEGDLGVRKGVQIVHRRPELPGPAEVLAAGANWAPHRSLACLYLWRIQDLQVPVE